MEPQIRTLVDIAGSKADLHGRADMMLERARWAGQIFQRYDRPATMAIVDAVARAAHANAGKYADWAVEETGFGVAAHKKLKNELSRPGLSISTATTTTSIRASTPMPGWSGFRAPPAWCSR